MYMLLNILWHSIKHKGKKPKICLPIDSTLLPQFKSFINYLREKDEYHLISKKLKRQTFSCIKGSSWFASTGLPGWRVGKGTNEIFFTAAQNHFPHLMKLSRIVEPTVKLRISVGKFYKQKCLRKESFYKLEISFSSCPLPHPHQRQSFNFLHDSIFHV